MSFQTVFKRYELKYLISPSQKQALLEAMKAYMEPDRYGRTTILNLYYDTDRYLLARRSIEKPVYKEKLRVRSYGRAGERDTVFVELKKKYKKVVYKRRLPMELSQAMAWLSREESSPKPTQISDEIDYVLDSFPTLHPVVFLSYRREAYCSRDASDLRVTFDDTVLASCSELSLSSDEHGQALLPQDKVLMEIKCAGGIPLWLAHHLSRERIFKTSFSKYGMAYKSLIAPQLMFQY